MTLMATEKPTPLALIEADFTEQRDALVLLLARVYEPDYVEHPHHEAFARVRDAVAATAAGAHKTRTANSAVRSEKFNRRGSLVRGDESFAECTCGGWVWHGSTRAMCRSAARRHREEAVRLILDQHDVAALWHLLLDRWTPIVVWDAIALIGAALKPELRTVAYFEERSRA